MAELDTSCLFFSCGREQLGTRPRASSQASGRAERQASQCKQSTSWGREQLGTRSHREAGPSDEPSNGTFQQWGIEQLSTHSYREAGPTTSYPM